jgi:hypothetical protein
MAAVGGLKETPDGRARLLPKRVDRPRYAATLEEGRPPYCQERLSKAVASIVDENHVDENHHTACVDAWMKRATTGASSERLVGAFNDGFAALWQRAHQSLADITLSAIADRVLHSAAAQFPVLSGLNLTPAGLESRELRERAGRLEGDRLADGIHFILVEFLTVLGTLTAEILTPALHSELSKAAAEAGGSNANVLRNDEGGSS